jgi:hypothetical protein
METIVELEATRKQLSKAYTAIASTPIMTYSIADRQIVYEQRKDLQDQISRLNRRIHARMGNSQWAKYIGAFADVTTEFRVIVIKDMTADRSTWVVGTILLIAFCSDTTLELYDLDDRTQISVAKAQRDVDYEIQNLSANSATSGFNLANFNDEK